MRVSLVRTVRSRCAGREAQPTGVLRDTGPCADRRLAADRPGYVAHAPALGLAGTSEAEIAETTGHTSLDMVRRYTRKADPFRRGVSDKVKL